MAIRYAVGDGNFSALATWNGGASIPTWGDYVYANSYTVVLDADVNIGSGTLSTEICPTTGAGGGVFTFNTNRIVIGNIKAGSTHCLKSTAGSNILSTLNVIGNVDGSSSTACGICQTISSGKNNRVEITGNISKYAVIFARQSNSSRVYFNLVGNATSSGGYCLITNISSASISVVEMSLNGIITGNGYEFADPANSTYAGFGQLGTYVLNGGVVAQTALKVIYCATAIVTGYIENFGGKLAVDASTSFQFTPTYYKIQDATGNDLILYPANALENPPAESDVRAGTVYGIGDTYEGSLIVPDPAVVVKGVPTDDTVGTWAFDDDLIERLKVCSTVEITGAQMASYEL